MIALAFLPPTALAQLRRALPPPHNVRPAATWDELVDDVRAARGDVIVVDPCTDRERDGARRARDLAAAHRREAPIPVIGYVSVTVAAIHAVDALVRAGAAEIIVRGVDDVSGGLEVAVRRAAAGSLAARLVGHLGEPFAALPRPLRAACHALFARPELTRCVDDLAAQARTTRRSLDRWLARAGLAPARRLLACSRVNAAFHLLAGGATRPARAAAALGYPSARALARELRALTGYTPVTLARGVAPDSFVAALAPRLLRHPEAGSRGSFTRRDDHATAATLGGAAAPVGVPVRLGGGDRPLHVFERPHARREQGRPHSDGRATVPARRLARQTRMRPRSRARASRGRSS